MRWLSTSKRPDDRGAVAVLAALSMVALIGFAAIAVDTGALYAERAQLQNGADAAALAVAQDCAADKTKCTDALQRPTATKFANANANDNAADVIDLVLPTPTTPNSVRVDVSTRDAKTGAGSLALMFAPILGIDRATVGAAATASWGSPAAGPAALPLAFSPCSFAGKLDGTTQVIETHGRSDICGKNASGQDIPGGFSWLKDTTGKCSALVDVAKNADKMSSDPGANLPPGCEDVLNSLKDKTVLLPVFSDVGKGGEGEGGWYKIDGWAAFHLLGWNFPPSWWNKGKCAGSCRGLIGQFVSFVALGDEFTIGGSEDLGASIVTLSPNRTSSP